MENFELAGGGGYHPRGGGGGGGHHQPNGIVPVGRPQFQQQPPIPENPHPNFGIGNGSAGGASNYNSNSNIGPMREPGPPSDPMMRGVGDRGQRDPVVGQSRSRDSRTRERDSSIKDSKEMRQALPKMLKIAVVGDSTAGKTAICQAVTTDGYNFNKNYHLTCGVGIHPKSIKLPEPVDSQGDRVNMILIDSSGKDIYTEYLPKYWDKINGMILVIDLSSKSSLESAGQWLQLAKGSMLPPQPRSSANNSSGDQGQQTGPSALGVLIGNKIDLTERRAISPKSAQEFATKNNLQYFECSVKDNSGLEEPFFYLAHQWVIGSLGGSSAGVHLSRTSSQDNENIPPSDDQF